MAREKERLRQKEIELQRRKLYPELYENGSKTGASRFMSDDLDEDDDDDLPTAVKPKKNADGSLSYFSDDEFSVPAESSEPTAGWRMPLD
jgi:hypothetical protein